MNDETLKALRASIDKWRANAVVSNMSRTRTGPKDCALCELFYAKGCVGCPVMERTKLTRCSGTPYDDAAFVKAAWMTLPRSPLPLVRFKAAARKEVAFLESLLPQEDSPA